MSKKRNLDLARDEMTLSDAARYLGYTPSALSHLNTRGKLHPRRYVGRSPIYDVRALDRYASNWNDVHVNPYEAEEMCPDATHSSIRSAARAGKILYCYQIGNRWQISVNGLREAGLLAPADDRPEQTSLDVDGEKDEETVESLHRRLDAARRERDLAVRDRMLLAAENERLKALVEESPFDNSAARRLADTRRVLREIGQVGGGRLPDLVNLLDALDSLDALDADGAIDDAADADDADDADDRLALTPEGEH